MIYAMRSRALTYLMVVEKQSSDVHLLDLIVQYPVLVEPYDRSPLAIEFHYGMTSVVCPAARFRKQNLKVSV